MPVIYMDEITTRVMMENPEWLFLFGDNLERRGRGGQAKVMRGQQNAVGVPTKRHPSNREDAFFRDHEDYEMAEGCYALIFQKLRAHLVMGGTVVIPTAGLGTGRARLAEKAPGIWSLLNKHLESLKKV